MVLRKAGFNISLPIWILKEQMHCTLDHLLRLVNQIQQGFADSCQTIDVFFDCGKAYDTTWYFGIIRLYKMGIQDNKIKLSFNFSWIIILK